MAKLYAGIDTERNTQVTRIGPRKLSVFVQTNENRITVNASPESFLIMVEDGRYRNMVGKSGQLAEVKDGKIYISASLKEKIVFTS